MEQGAVFCLNAELNVRKELPLGATKADFKNIRAITTREIQVLSFELQKEQKCRIITTDEVQKGDTLLIKASFLNACLGHDEMGNPDEDNILYRRRVVPFVTRVTDCRPIGKKKRNRIFINIENISETDCSYLYRKMADGTKESNMLEIEAKKITFVL